MSAAPESSNFTSAQTAPTTSTTSGAAVSANAIATAAATTSAAETHVSVVNPRGYPPFVLSQVPTYTNRQLRYYQTSGAILSVDRDALKTQIAIRKSDMQLTDWDGESQENTPEPNPPANPTASPSVQPLSPANTPAPSLAGPAASLPPSAPASHVLSLNPDSEPDSDCPKKPRDYKGIKFSSSDITKLRHDSKCRSVQELDH